MKEIVIKGLGLLENKWTGEISIRCINHSPEVLNLSYWANDKGERISYLPIMRVVDKRVFQGGYGMFKVSVGEYGNYKEFKRITKAVKIQ